MKPCADRQKLITWLALDALDAPSAKALRAHLETCPGCRSYLAEISQVTNRLTVAAPSSDIQSSERFHRQVMARIKSETPVPWWESVASSLRALLFNWRVAVPAVAALMILTVILQWPPAAAPSRPVASIRVPAVVPVASVAPAPTIANYQRAASQSPDKLDELLVQQGKEMSSPSPICTAAANSLTF